MTMALRPPQASADSFYTAADCLPPRVRMFALHQPTELASETEEFRLRAGRPLAFSLADGEWSPPDAPVMTAADMQSLLEIASKSSVHAVMESLRAGYITVSGGHRIGFCGTAVVKQGEIHGLKHLSSASIRIAREYRGVADGLYKALFREGRRPNILMVSPPGAGKTTLMRDLIRQISDGGVRVSVADERGEIAGMFEGKASFDLGRCTDVLEQCAKADAMLMLLRAMNPQYIAVDEVTAARDAEAMATAANCGVGLLATAHADGMADLKTRPIYRAIRELFDTLVVIERKKGKRLYSIETVGRSDGAAKGM